MFRSEKIFSVFRGRAWAQRMLYYSTLHGEIDWRFGESQRERDVGVPPRSIPLFPLPWMRGYRAQKTPRTTAVRVSEPKNDECTSELAS